MATHLPMLTPPLDTIHSYTKLQYHLQYLFNQAGNVYVLLDLGFTNAGFYLPSSYCFGVAAVHSF